jgi:PAS domain S-box-containing protein/putative nucleotidyltransferase with HDIG domain
MTFKMRRKREEEIYGTLFRNSADGIYVVSRGGFEYVNPAFERLVGYSAKEIYGPGFDLLGFIHPDDRKLVGEGMDARDGIFEFRIVSRDGGTKYVEAGTSTLSRNGGRVMGILRETTARRLADRSLQENEEKYRHVVERASDGIAIIQDSLFKFINPRAAEIGGFTLDELIDTPFSRYLATEDITALESTYQREPDAEGAPVIFEAAVKRKDGTTTKVELSAGRISYQGKPASLVILRDVTDRRRTEEELSLTLEKLRKAMGATIQAMSLTIETRDPYTAGHQKRVSDLARAIATEMKLNKEDIDAIRMAASIHDLGKISIPAEILSKPGKINEFEFRLIQNHPQIGYEILRTIEFPWPIAEIVLQHHERINGSGYPNGLRGEEIHIIARILAVADVVEAMISHRPYRSALTLGEAIHEITKNRGTLYDPDAVDACKLLFIEGRFAFKA